MPPESRRASLCACAHALHAVRARPFRYSHVTPQNAPAGDAIAVNIYQEGHCDAIDYGGIPGYPWIYGEGTGSWPLGAYGAGSYTLQIDLRYFNGGEYVIETLGIVSFAVVGPAGTPAAAPSLDGAAVVVLSLSSRLRRTDAWL